MRPGSPASKAYEVFLLFVASNIVRYAGIKAGEPGDEAIPCMLASSIVGILVTKHTCIMISKSEKTETQTPKLLITDVEKSLQELVGSKVSYRHN